MHPRVLRRQVAQDEDPNVPQCLPPATSLSGQNSAFTELVISDATNLHMGYEVLRDQPQNDRPQQLGIDIACRQASLLEKIRKCS